MIAKILTAVFMVVSKTQDHNICILLAHLKEDVLEDDVGDILYHFFELPRAKYLLLFVYN